MYNASPLNQIHRNSVFEAFFLSYTDMRMAGDKQTLVLARYVNSALSVSQLSLGQLHRSEGGVDAAAGGPGVVESRA